MFATRAAGTARRGDAMRRESAADPIWIWGAVVLAVLVGLAAATYYHQREPAAAAGGAALQNGATPAAGRAAAPAAAALPASPRPSEAAEPEPPPEPLPALDESDDEVLGFLAVFVGRAEVERFVVPERVIRNTVVTIDNLAREKVNPQQRPIKPTPGEFLVEGTDEAPVLSAANYARYEPLVGVLAAVDTKTVVALYRRLYPLFREAYDALGHRSGNFHTRLLEVIENLLAAPDVQGPIRLERPAVLYKYADPALESLTPGQKLLIRMGPENARKVKAKLREFRDELV